MEDIRELKTKLLESREKRDSLLNAYNDRCQFRAEHIRRLLKEKFDIEVINTQITYQSIKIDFYNNHRTFEISKSLEEELYVNVVGDSFYLKPGRARYHINVGKILDELGKKKEFYDEILFIFKDLDDYHNTYIDAKDYFEVSDKHVKSLLNDIEVSHFLKGLKPEDKIIHKTNSRITVDIVKVTKKSIFYTTNDRDLYPKGTPVYRKYRGGKKKSDIDQIRMKRKTEFFEIIRKNYDLGDKFERAIKLKTVMS